MLIFISLNLKNKFACIDVKWHSSAKLSVASSLVRCFSLWRLQVWAFCLGCAEGLIICLSRGFHECVTISTVLPSDLWLCWNQTAAEVLESHTAQLHAVVSVLLDANVVLINLSLGSLCCGCCSCGVLVVLGRQSRNMGGSSWLVPRLFCGWVLEMYRAALRGSASPAPRPSSYFSKQDFLGWKVFVGFWVGFFSPPRN